RRGARAPLPAVAHVAGPGAGAQGRPRLDAAAGGAARLAARSAWPAGRRNGCAAADAGRAIGHRRRPARAHRPHAAGPRGPGDGVVRGGPVRCLAEVARFSGQPAGRGRGRHRRPRRSRTRQRSTHARIVSRSRDAGGVRQIVRRTGTGTVAGAESLNPVIGRVLANREIESIDQLAFSSRDLLRPDAMSQIDRAAQLIADHVRGGSTIMVLGDYDADGATSCALAVLALRAMGAARADYLVPDRFKLGYGLSPALVDLAAAERPGLLVTVDNGISSVAGAARARELGIALVITDHHLPG